MKKRTWIHLGMIIAMVSLSACGKKNGVSNQVTEQLDVEDGIVFQMVEDDVIKETETNLSELVLTAEDIEGMQERNIALKKYAKIYAKPSAESAVIGEGGRGEVLTVYEKSEDGAWYIVSYNGRIGYVKEDCIKEDVPEEKSEHKDSSQNKNSRPNNKNHSDTNANSGNNQTQNNGQTQNPGNTQTQQPNNNQTQNSGNSDNSQNNSETQPPSETDNSENNSETQLPNGTDNPENNSETQLPNGTDNPENNSETPSPSGTDNSENNNETQQSSETYSLENDNQS